MTTRVNVNIPKALYQKAHSLVSEGYFSNFSEVIREALRKEIVEYSKSGSLLEDDEKKLFSLLKKAEQEGQLVDEEEMKGHGLQV
tara:strand:+ start:81 stop:335 length:255 start_codon:yes stop_codon:yes gene_type:complete